MPTGLTSFDHRLAFWHTDGVHGWELWLTDGTPGGTAMAFELVEGPGGSAVPELRNEHRGPRRSPVLRRAGRWLRQRAGLHRRISARTDDLRPGPGTQLFGSGRSGPSRPPNLLHRHGSDPRTRALVVRSPTLRRRLRIRRHLGMEPSGPRSRIRLSTAPNPRIRRPLPAPVGLL